MSKDMDTSRAPNITGSSTSPAEGRDGAHGSTETENDNNLDVSAEPTELNDSMNESIVTRVLDRVVIVFPKVEPLPWDTFFKIALICAIPAAVYVVLFTSMGIGLKIFQYVSEYLEHFAMYLAAALAGFIFSLYILDFTDWSSKVGSLCKNVSWTIFIVGTMFLVLCLSGEYPYGPICLFAVITPLWLVLSKQLFFRKKNTRIFVSWLSGPLFFISLLTFFLWLIWTFLRVENEWNEVTRLEYAQEAGCTPNFNEYPNCTKKDSCTIDFISESNCTEDVCFEIMRVPPDIYFPDGCEETCVSVYDGCLNTFILWVGPLLVSLSMFFLSFFCTFLRTEGTDEKDIINFGRLWIFLLFSMWVTAALSGIGAGVTTALLALTLASFAGSVIFLVSSLSRPDQKEQAKEVWGRVREKYGSNLDIAKGLAIVVSAPLALVYLMLSFLNQCVRKLGICHCSKKIEEESDEWKLDLVTERTRKQIQVFRTWDRSKVYTYAIYWGIAFMILQVIVAQLTVLFLSWLIEKTSQLNLGAVTGIMVGIGLAMFLLPPVPGVPIYLTLGIVVVAIGHETLGYVGSMAYAAAVSLALKLLACALQQKLIGENLSHYISVRQFVGINSKLIRSMRLVLAERGLGIAKVSILIGGPDWPTSVLCGIMGLELIPILIGTLPIIFLILPTMLTGSFTYMASLQENGKPTFPWASVAVAIFTALTAIVQFGSMLVAAFYLEQTTSLREDEINAIPIDEKVKEAEDKAAYMSEIYSEVTQWDVVPLWAKLTLTLSLACIVTCCYMVQLFSASCFADYGLTYTIGKDLNGDWTNLFLPLGRIAILIFVVSCVLLQCFTWWATRKAAAIVAGRRISPEHPGADGDENEEEEELRRSLAPSPRYVTYQESDPHEAVEVQVAEC